MNTPCAAWVALVVALIAASLTALGPSAVPHAGAAGRRDPPTPAAAPATTPATVERLPAIEELPDPFLMNDGARVRTRDDWRKRREELKAAILHYEYGPLPPPAKVEAAEVSSGKHAALDAVERKITLTARPEGGEKAVQWPLELTIPRAAAGRKLPVIVRGDLCWKKVAPEILQAVVERGYILAEFDRTAVAPDSKDRSRGVWPVWPDYDGSVLSAWAWGFHRTIDYLLTLDVADPQRIAVTGHSRGGKAALLAGAMDERIALTNPNGSGAGGSSAYRVRRPDAESLARITTVFPFWFHSRFRQFQDKESLLPFDQHSLRALVAPRGLLATGAMGDLWANPAGDQQAHLASAEVFRFLGAADKIGIHYRQGKHEHNLTDWTALLDFADKVLLGKTVQRRFDQLPYPQEPKAFSWSAPAAP